jgi:uncharacterized protein YaiI (UPF0178 family)
LRPITIYIDADACPVKQEIYRVAERHARKGTALKVFVVSNSPIAVPPNICWRAAGRKTGCHFCWPPACRQQQPDRRPPR